MNKTYYETQVRTRDVGKDKKSYIQIDLDGFKKGEEVCVLILRKEEYCACASTTPISEYMKKNTRRCAVCQKPIRIGTRRKNARRK